MKDVLVGREAEIAKLENALAEARSAKGSHHLLIGAAGIGKTALVNRTCQAASESGFSVLRGCSEKERAQPFDSLNQAFSKVSSAPLFEDRQTVSFREVFVINRAGLLLAKASATQGDLDADIFAGMLTAVQNFVRDSFDPSGSGSQGLGRLEYGDMKILIENGQDIFLTAVLVGQEHPDMASVLRSAAKAIEAEHAGILSNWSGNIAQMDPVQRGIEALLARQFQVRKDMAGVNLVNEINRISEAALASISGHCQKAPVLLVLEDMHWAGESDLKVVEYLARNCAGLPLLLLTTARSSESGAFEQSRQRMSADGLVCEMPLAGFTAIGLRKMLDALYQPNSFPDDMVSALYSKTGGNPFFAREMARHLEISGSITLANGRFDYSGAVDSLPSTVEALIASRLDTLDPGMLRVAEVASCMGMEFDLEVLSQLPMMGDLGAKASALGTAGICHASENSASFTHGLYQEVIYGTISTRWRAKYHSELGGYYERAFADRLDDAAYELARHFSRAGDKPKALEYCTRAGEKAEASFAAERAIAYYRDALDACQADRERQAMLHDRMGDLSFILSDCKGAIAHYESVFGLVDDVQGKAEMRRKIADSYEKLSDYDNAKAEAEKGLDMLPEGESPVKARLLLSIGRVQMRQGDYQQSLQNLSKAVEAAERHGLKRDLGMAEHLLGSVHLHKGEFPEAREHFERAVAIRTEIGDISGVAASQNNIGNVLARTGEWDQALEYYTTSCKTDAKLGDKLGHASTLTNIASVHLSMGRPEQAIPILEESIAIEKSIGDQRGLAISLINLNLAHYLQKDYEKALGILKEALEICEKNSLRYECIFCFNGLCELYSLLGDPASGLEMAERSLALSRELGTKEGEAMSFFNIGAAQTDLGRMEEARENLERALALMEEINHNQIFDACLSLGSYWKKAGDPVKARHYLERAMAGYEENRNERDVERCRKLLEGM